MLTLLDIVDPNSSIPALIECPLKPNGSIKRELSRKQLRLEAEKVSNSLSNAQVFSLSLKNTFEFVVCFLAAVGSNRRVAPLNPGTTEKEALEVFEDAKVDCVIVDDEKSGAALAGRKMNLPVFFINRNYQLHPLTENSIVSSKISLPFPSCNPSSIALYLFTSGTTSKPKLVPLTHHNMMTSIINIRNHYELDQTDRCYSVMPLFHIHGLQAALFASLAGGGTVLLPEDGKFSASVFWRDVVAFQATWYTAVPTMHQILLSRSNEDKSLIDQNKLRFIRSCSSPLAAPVLEQLEKMTGRPVLEAYAMTEAAHQMTSNPLPKHGPHKPGSVGRATNVQLKIEGSKDKAFAQGEVCIRGNNVMLGYVNRPEANAEAFDELGWFRTGDLGYLDEHGYLFITGRIKEIVNRGGEKISPPEIDAAILTMEGIGEAVSFGMPSTKYGEELYAAVVKSSKFSGEIKEKDIISFLQTKLAKVKVPTRIFVVDVIPKSATGKVQRKNLSAHFAKELMTSKL